MEANRDITERKRLEQDLIRAAKELAEKTLAQFRANIDSMSEGMLRRPIPMGSGC